MNNFSVLMSVYHKEKKEYFYDSLKSVFCQSVLPNEVVIVVDGPITKELEYVLESFKEKYKDIIKIVRIKENVGLGLALATGIKNCSNELIARMDSDDICVRDRFEKQLEYFNKFPEIDVCGSYISEFETNVNEIVSIRKVPLSHKEIAEYQKRRSAVNHMTVMYKKSAVINAGNYQDAKLMEDDVLWINMLKNGSKFANIGESLVFARIGDGMIERRGGMDYLKKYINGRKIILKTGYISYFDYIYTVIIQCFVALMPEKLRKFVFYKILRKQ